MTNQAAGLRTSGSAVSGRAPVADQLLSATKREVTPVVGPQIKFLQAGATQTRAANKNAGTMSANKAAAQSWLSKLFTDGERRKERTADHYRAFGAKLLNKRQHPEAVKILEKAIELGADDLECQLNLGLAYARTGRLQDAIALLNDLKASYPKDAGVATLLGKSLLYDGQYRKAIKIMRPAADIHSDRFNLHFNLGIAYAKCTEFALAVDAWSQAAKLRPEHAENRRLLAKALDAMVAQAA